MRLGLSLPEHLLSDEKFATLTGERIYLFLVSQGELIWHGARMNSVNETAFNEAIDQFRSRYGDISQGRTATRNRGQ